MNGQSKIEVMNIRRLDGSKIKAYADVMFDETYLVKGFRIVEGKDGLFVGFPQEVGKNGRWYNKFEVVDEGAKKTLSELVMTSCAE